jgi:hypothetical protein
MVKHRSSTRWPGDREVGWRCIQPAACTRWRGARIFWFSLKTKVDGFSWFVLKPLDMVFVVWPQNHPLEFPGFGLKTGSWCLVILLTKSPQWFLGLCLKTKWAIVWRLRLRTDGRMNMPRDTRRDLAACFGWKRVGLGFPSLASRLVEVQRGWCKCHL